MGTSGSEGGSRKRTGRNPGTAPRSDPYSKLKGPAKWTWFYLYVILDVFSRFAARRKTAVLFPDALCGRRRRGPTMTGANGPVVTFSGT